MWMWMWLNMCRRNVKYDRFVAIRCVFSNSKYSKTRFPPGLCHGPRWAIYDASPDLLVGWGWGQPLPIAFPPRRLQRLDLGAFGASLVRSRTHIPGYVLTSSTPLPRPTSRTKKFKSFVNFALNKYQSPSIGLFQLDTSSMFVLLCTIVVIVVISLHFHGIFNRIHLFGYPSRKCVIKSVCTLMTD